MITKDTYICETIKDKVKIREEKNDFSKHLGLLITKITKDSVESTLEIKEHHLQPFGITHGGVYLSIAENIMSIASSVNINEGQQSFGAEFYGSHLSSTSSGILIAKTTPIKIGRSVHRLESNIYNENNKLISKCSGVFIIK